MGIGVVDGWGGLSSTGSCIFTQIQYKFVCRPNSELNFQMSLCRPLVVLVENSSDVTFSFPNTDTHTHTYMNIHTPWRPLRLYPGLSGVVDSVVDTLGAPE